MSSFKLYRRRRRSFITYILAVVLFLNINAMCRIFFVGSNPYLSYSAFPQDLLRFASPFVSYSISYQHLPWWGDIDEPTKKPNDTYIAIAEKNLNEKSNNSYFKHAASIHVAQSSFGLFQTLTSNISSLAEFGYILSSQGSVASGNLTCAENGSFIPFSYAVHNSLHEGFIRWTCGLYSWGIPCGIKVQATMYNLSNPDVEFRFQKDARAYRSPRLLWGWSTKGCNHIFGTANTDGDAWLQNEYTQGPLIQTDIQIGATVSRFKNGIRLRYIYGSQDQYSWVQDSSTLQSIPDQKIWQNFSGSYKKSQWLKITHDLLLRLYTNVDVLKSNFYVFKTLFFLGLENATAQNALSDNSAIVDDRKDKRKNVIIEINPNISLFNPRNSDIAFFDGGILLEYSYTHFANIGEYYISGGRKEGYRNSQVYVGKEYSWESFSYAHEHFYDAGFDMNMTLPLYQKDRSVVALGIVLFANSKITYLTKSYGTTTVDGTVLTYTSDNLRKNKKTEFWFNSALSIHCMQSIYHFRLDVIEPLLYSLTPSTKVIGNDLKTKLYESSTSGNWVSQQGVKINLSITYKLPGYQK